MTKECILSEYLIKKYKSSFEANLSKYEGDNKLFYKGFFDYNKRLKSEEKEIKRFLGFLKNRNAVADFVSMIKNIKKKKDYERFFSSILIYMRIDSLEHAFDKFLYLCIAVESCMNYGIKTSKKKGQLFREFFSENLSEKSKLKIISSFQDKKVKNIIHGSQLLAGKIMIENGKKVKFVKKPENTLLPKCFEMKNCYIEYGGCYPDTLCAIKGDVTKVNTRLFFVLDYLYSKRSNFVHEGIAFSHPMSIPEKNYTDAGILDAYKEPSTKQFIEVHYNLDFKDLCFLYEEALLNHFTNVIKGADT